MTEFIAWLSSLDSEGHKSKNPVGLPFSTEASTFPARGRCAVSISVTRGHAQVHGA